MQFLLDMMDNEKAISIEVDNPHCIIAGGFNTDGDDLHIRGIKAADGRIKSYTILNLTRRKKEIIKVLE